MSSLPNLQSACKIAQCGQFSSRSNNASSTNKFYRTTTANERIFGEEKKMSHTSSSHQHANDIETRMLEAVMFVQSRLGAKPVPDVAMILGSGLGDLADRIEDAVRIDYADIPHFMTSKVQGHKNCLVIGKLAGVNVIVQQGRFHFYEGHRIVDLVFPLRVMFKLGAHTLIVTNAAGGVNKNFSAGDLMLISDHINLLGDNPLVGDNCESLGPRFCDMSFAYTPALRDVAHQQAKLLNIKLQEGVYCAMKGPSYETPAEIRMLTALGGDAVGMSTVPEVIIASHMSMRVLGLSCITNMAAGIQKTALNHHEVIDTANAAKASFQKLIVACLPQLAKK